MVRNVLSRVSLGLDGWLLQGRLKVHLYVVLATNLPPSRWESQETFFFSLLLLLTSFTPPPPTISTI